MTPSPPPRRTRAESLGRTRAELLAAGADLLREQPVGAVLSQVTAGEVARRAGRTIGAFYHHWKDQDSYRRDLLAHVLAPEQVPSQATATAVADALAQGADVAEIVRLNARANFDYGVQRPEFVLSLALWPLAREDDDVKEIIARLYGAATDTLVPAYEALFAANGWVPRPPFTVRAVAVTLTALLDGLVVRACVDPDAVPLALPAPDGGPAADGEAWDLFGAVALALLPMMAMPAQDAGTSGTDVRDVVRSLWETWRAQNA